MLPSEVLSTSADILKVPGAWIKENFARDKHGRPVASTSKHAVCFCSIGVIHHVTKSTVRQMNRDKDNVLAIVNSYLNVLSLGSEYNCIVDYNDDPETTQEDIIKFFRGAAMYAESKGL